MTDREINLEVGRVVLFNFGPYSGRLAVVLNMVSATRILVSGPGLGVPKTLTNARRLRLTKFRLASVTSEEKEKSLTEKIAAAKVQEVFDATALGTKLKNQKIRRGLSDFQRFKAQQLRVKMNKLIRQHVNKNKTRLAQA
ncbi:MAG: hypothetical protein AAFO58_12930 [Pseudomonadota bacterium]